MTMYMYVLLTVTVVSQIINIPVKEIIFLFLQAILEQELRPYFDGKWKGLGDPHLSSYGTHALFTFRLLSVTVSVTSSKY